MSVHNDLGPSQTGTQPDGSFKIVHRKSQTPSFLTRGDAARAAMKASQELKAGLGILKHVIESLETAYPRHPVTRPDSTGRFDATDYDLTCEISYIFAVNGRAGHLGTMPDGTRWNAGMTLSDRRDEDGDSIYEPVFGFFLDGIHGGTVWQGEELIKRVREALTP